MLGNGLDLTMSEVAFTKCRGGRGGIPPQAGLRVYLNTVYPVEVLVIVLLLTFRDDVDGHGSHPTRLPVHLFTALIDFLVSVSRRCRAVTFLAKGDNRVGLR